MKREPARSPQLSYPSYRSRKTTTDALESGIVVCTLLLKTRRLEVRDIIANAVCDAMDVDDLERLTAK